MNKILYPAAFGLALLALGWVALGYGLASPLALLLVLLIAGFFLLGSAELQRYRRATQGLLQQLQGAAPPSPAADAALPVDTAAADPQAALQAWLAPLHPSLHASLQLRLQGQRVALPGPVLAPYLTGLLVLLGMLGTFLGLVMTLQGTGLALEQASDVEAIRASLAAPVRGLGLAFGTSVAGVAASAALGLMTVLARNERQRAGQWLDTLAQGPLRRLNPALLRAEQQALQRTAQRQAARGRFEEQLLQLLQAQGAQLAQLGSFGQQLPALLGELQALAQHTRQQGEQLQQQLLQGQARAQAETTAALQQALGQLAAAVGGSLQDSLAESARAAGAVIEPAVQRTLQALAQEHGALQASVAQAHAALQASVVQEHAALQASVVQEHAALQADVAQQHQALQASLQAQHAALQQSLREEQQAVHAGLQAQHAAMQAGWAQAVQQQLAGMGEQLQAQATQVVQQLAQAQASQAQAAAEQASTQLQGLRRELGDAMAAQAQGLVDEVGRLVQLSADAPRAAAVVIGELRTALSESLVRDNAALAERQQLLGTVAGLLTTLQQAGGEQRAAIDSLVQAAGQLLHDASRQLQSSAEHSQQAQQAALAEAGQAAAQLASLAQGFGAGVEEFARASGESTAQLARTEAALAQALARSDEQLAYYVAQAREIVDLTLGTQREVMEELQQVVPRLQAGMAAATSTGAAPAAGASTAGREGPA